MRHRGKTKMPSRNSRGYFCIHCSNEEFGSVRVVLRDDVPWFFASDVAKALGYSNPSRSVQDHCKHVELFRTTNTVGLDINPRGELVVPESDVAKALGYERPNDAVNTHCKKSINSATAIHRVGRNPITLFLSLMFTPAGRVSRDILHDPRRGYSFMEDFHERTRKGRSCQR